ncbi:FRG domain-containing protein [Cobetia sp. D5]|uniref:FRG domain-containing protein n=1 Tax=Cobetia sp. D5 TaxID=3105867 RepID=UPI002D76EC76|nr:FRG domain-containing protein [Cobetia sp. D5]
MKSDHPAPYTYENRKLESKVGYIKNIKERGRELFIEFEVLNNVNSINFSELKKIADLLDIRDWEMNRTHWAVKEEDLFERLSDAGLMEADGLMKKDKLNKPVFHQAVNPRVTTVQGFIGKVLGLEQAIGTEVFYRGHSNKKDYRIEPSLFRKDKSGNYLYKDNEHVLYRELLVSNSADFQSDESTLDSLVRMQHYSLPTRLLDITSNPLVALYFACKESKVDVGEVIIFSMDRDVVKYFDSDVASCIANLARLPQTDKDKISFDVEDFNSQAPISRLVHLIRGEKPFFDAKIVPEDLRKVICVKGKRSNDRIMFQSGAFLLFGLDAIFNENGTSEIKVTRITVSNKKAILKELDALNINDSTLFPYIDNSAKYVAEKYMFNVLD